MNIAPNQSVESDADRLVFFTAEDHDNIEAYVAYGTRLPTVIQAVTVYIGYDHAGVAGLEPADMKDLFTKIRTHASKWEDVNDKIAHQTRQLASISTKVVSEGGSLIRTIKKMAFYKKIVATVGDDLDHLAPSELPVEAFTDEDAAKRPSLLKTLDAIGTLNAQQIDATDSTMIELTAFKREIGLLEPVVANKAKAIKRSNLEIGKETTVEPMIAALQAEYDRTVSTSGPGGPIAKAKKKELGAAINTLKSQIEGFKSQQRVTYTMGRLFVHFSEIGLAMVDAETALVHLWTDWATATSALENSKQQLGNIDDSQKLVSFVNTFQLAINDWDAIKDRATALYRAF